MRDFAGDILIVDDRPENLSSLEEALSGLGREIVRATSGQQALQILLERDFAVILLDVRMPEMDGLETARYIRAGKRSLHTPIIFVTAGDDRVEDVVRGYSAGAVDYMIKPLQIDILRSKVGVFLDLYRKNLELSEYAREVTRSHEELRKAYKELEVISYTVAHDLRAPLRAMSGFSEMLSEEYRGRPLDAAGLDYLQRIERGAKRMDTLINSLLAYCRIAGLKMELEKVDLQATVRQAVDENTSGTGSNAQIAVSDSLPPVLGHREVLKEALSHLVSNAIKFVAPGLRPLVRIRHECRGGRVRLWVEDNGVGIEPEHHERIFKTFERLDPLARGGPGMGLAIVRAAIERMGGQVGLESTPGAGSRFWVELPECDGPAETPALHITPQVQNRP